MVHWVLAVRSTRASLLNTRDAPVDPGPNRVRVVVVTYVPRVTVYAPARLIKPWFTALARAGLHSVAFSYVTVPVVVPGFRVA
jgi:hypothetical protein